MSKALDALVQKSHDEATRNRNALIQLADQNHGKALADAKGEFNTTLQRFRALVKPLSENYQKIDQQVEGLTKETRSLADALKGSRRVGNWGEMQLRRVVELAGFADRSSVDGL